MENEVCRIPRQGIVLYCSLKDIIDWKGDQGPCPLGDSVNEEPGQPDQAIRVSTRTPLHNHFAHHLHVQKVQVGACCNIETASNLSGGTD